jgi:hypothetical protein
VGCRRAVRRRDGEGGAHRHDPPDVAEPEPLELLGALDGVERLDEEPESELLELELDPADVPELLEVEPLDVDVDVVALVEPLEPPPLRSLAAVAEKMPTSATPATAAPRVRRRTRRTPWSRRRMAEPVPGSGPAMSMTVPPPVVCARKTKQSWPEVAVSSA